MSYGLHHPRTFPPRIRVAWRFGGRTPSAVARWAIAQVLSHSISGLVAILCTGLVAGVLFAILAACGVLDRDWSNLLNSLIGSVLMGSMVAGYREMRDLTRPPQLPPPVEFSSGRSSPLYDRELDGGL